MIAAALEVGTQIKFSQKPSCVYRERKKSKRGHLREEDTPESLALGSYLRGWVFANEGRTTEFVD